MNSRELGPPGRMAEGRMAGGCRGSRSKNAPNAPLLRIRVAGADTVTARDEPLYIPQALRAAASRGGDEVPQGMESAVDVWTHDWRCDTSAFVLAANRVNRE